jgi:hypothetical protein
MHGRLGLITLRAPDRTTPSSGVSWRKFVRKSSVETPGAAVGKRRSAACEGSTPHVLPPLNRVENAIASGRDVEPDIDQNLRAVFRIFEHGRLEAMLVEPNAHRGHSFGKIDRVHPNPTTRRLQKSESFAIARCVIRPHTLQKLSLTMFQ